MELKPQSIRKGITIWVNGEISDKKEVIELSKTWSEVQINFFKKMIKQGGEFKVAGTKFKIQPQPKITTSKGEKDGGVEAIPGLDSRF